MLFTNLNGFKWVQDDGTMLISMVEMSTKKEKKQATKKKKRVRSPAARLICSSTRWRTRTMGFLNLFIYIKRSSQLPFRSNQKQDRHIIGIIAVLCRYT